MTRTDELRMSDSQVASSSLPACGLTEPEAPVSPSRPIRKCKSELDIHDPSLDHHFDPLDRCTSDAFISPTSSSAPSKISIGSTRAKRNSFHQRSKSLTHYRMKADFMVPIPPTKVLASLPLLSLASLTLPEHLGASLPVSFSCESLRR